MNILDFKDKIKIPRRDLYCIAKGIQGLENFGSITAGCAFCKLDCRNSNNIVQKFSNIKERLQEVTGVSTCFYPEQRTTAFSGVDPETISVQ